LSSIMCCIIEISSTDLRGRERAALLGPTNLQFNCGF
jgi:hypothetical protein